MLKTTNYRTTDTITDELCEQVNACQTFPATVSVLVGEIEPLAWLDAQPAEVKFAWSERECDQIIAGVGEAASVLVEPNEDLANVVRRCRDAMRRNEAMRFYGGLSFDGSDDWEQFGAGRFLIPRLLLKDGKLHVNVMDREDVVAATLDVQQLNFEFGDLPTNLPAPTNIRHSPTSDGWQSNVDEALTLIRSEVLEKVVLARKTTMTFDEPLNPIIVAALIAEATYDCYVFCFQFGDQRGFVGATPERLFKRSGHQLLSQIVAGTRPRGITSGDDQRLAYELLTSDKDQLEHDIVRKSIRQKLHKFVDHLDVDTQASVLRLARKQHLCSEVQGKLKEGIEEGALLKRLHPTPAVGGYPTENALPEIARLEPFNRGWYAAPIGWIGANDAEFVVGIRSGLVEGSELSLFSGAGIVKGSIPDQEWEEVDNKIRDFVDILGTST